MRNRPFKLESHLGALGLALPENLPHRTELRMGGFLKLLEDFAQVLGFRPHLQNPGLHR